MSLINSTTHSMCLRLSSDENFASNKNGAMVTSADYLGNPHISHSWIKISHFSAFRRRGPITYALSPHVFVASREKHAAHVAIRENWMIVTCRNEVNRHRKIYQLRNLLDPLPPKCSFVVASKAESLTITRQDYCMQSSTSNFEDLGPKEGIDNDLIFTLRFFSLCLDFKLLDFAEANWTFRLALLSRVVVLVWLARPVDIELQFAFASWVVLALACWLGHSKLIVIFIWDLFCYITHFNTTTGQYRVIYKLWSIL